MYIFNSSFSIEIYLYSYIVELHSITIVHFVIKAPNLVQKWRITLQTNLDIGPYHFHATPLLAGTGLFTLVKIHILSKQ